MAEETPDGERPDGEQPRERDERGEPALPPLEQWPEDEGSAPHSRPEPVSIPRLLLRAAPRVSFAVLLAFLYSASEGATALAFLLSWLLVVGSMLLPRWRRYVETGQKDRPAPAEPLIVPDDPKPSTPYPLPETRSASGPAPGATSAPASGAASGAPAEDDEPLDPRDSWDLPDELPGEKRDGETP